MGGRAALAPGRSLSCRAPRAPDPKGKTYTAGKGSVVLHCPRDLTLKTAAVSSSANPPRAEHQGNRSLGSCLLGSREQGWVLHSLMPRGQKVPNTSLFEQHLGSPGCSGVEQALTQDSKCSQHEGCPIFYTSTQLPYQNWAELENYTIY